MCPDRAEAAGCTPSRSLGNMLVSEKFQAGAAHSVTVCSITSTQLELQPELTAGDPSTMPCRAERILVGKPGCSCRFCRSQEGSTAPSHLTLGNPSPQLWLWDRAQSSRALAGPQGMSGMILPFPPEKQFIAQGENSPTL